MCPPKAPKVASIPERQSVKLPDGGATAPRTDEIARRRRGMLATVMTSPSGLGSPPTVTSTTLGG